MPAAALLLISLGKWRYFITGLAVAVFAGLLLRTVSRVSAPPGKWRRFRGKCTAAEPHGSRTAALIAFTDRSRLRHTAALLTDTPLAPEDDAVIAIRTEVFAAGAYPQTLAEASDKDILTGAECKRLIRRQMGRELLTGLILCGIALGAVILTMRLCVGSQ